MIRKRHTEGPRSFSEVLLLGLQSAYRELESLLLIAFCV